MPKSKVSEDKFMNATMMQQSTYSKEIKGLKSQLRLLKDAIEEYSKLLNHVNHDMSVHLADMR
jgi:hypothetical protein